MVKSLVVLVGSAIFGLGASVTGIGQSSGDKTINALSAPAYLAHANHRFKNADFDADGLLSADEYVAMSVVFAELTRLKGYARVAVNDDESMAVPLKTDLSAGSQEDPFAKGLSYGERTRIDAVTRRDFYSHAGADGLLSRTEYVQLSWLRFVDADRNDDGILKGAELLEFSSNEAAIAQSNS